MAILFTNIRGLIANLDDLVTSLSASNPKPDIIVLTETFLSPTIPDQAIHLNGYTSFRHDRISHGGGVAVYYKSALTCERLLNYETCHHETIWFRLIVKQLTVNFCAAYWPPNSENDLTEHLAINLNALRMDSKSINLLIGDFNAHHTNWPHCTHANPAGTKINDFINSHAMTQLVIGPTRFGPVGTTPSMLDLAITNVPSIMKFEFIGPTIGSSDHATVRISICIPHNLADPPQHCTRLDHFPTCSSATDWNQIKNDFENVDWDCLFQPTNSMESMYETFINTYHTITTKYSYQPKRVPKPNVSLPANIIELIALRKRNWNAFRRTQSQLDLENFRRARAALKSAIRREQRAKLERKLLWILSQNNAKSWYKLTKTLFFGQAVSTCIPALKSNDKFVESDADKANILNDTFLSRGSTADSQKYPVFPTRRSKLFSDCSFDQKAVENCLIALDISKSTGPDGVQNIVLKNCASSLSYPLYSIFAKSLDLGCLAPEWKFAKVTPIFKNKGDRSDPLQYRPISILSNVSKVLEKLINDSLLEFLCSNKLISSKQFGFLPKHSCSDQLALLLHNIMSAAEIKQLTLSIFLDLSAAFDTIPHAGIVHKLQSYGVRGRLFKWITNYLDSRSQSVLTNGYCSETRSVSSGVPQGSPLASTLFLIYINDIADQLPNCESITHDSDEDGFLYADDIMFKVSGTSLARLELAAVNQFAISCDNWSNIWGVNFNHSKTIVMLFSRTVTPLTNHIHLQQEGPTVKKPQAPWIHLFVQHVI